jgi:hypothetical protein
MIGMFRTDAYCDSQIGIVIVLVTTMARHGRTGRGYCMDASSM